MFDLEKIVLSPGDPSSKLNNKAQRDSENTCGQKKPQNFLHTLAKKQIIINLWNKFIEFWNHYGIMEQNKNLWK